MAGGKGNGEEEEEADEKMARSKLCVIPRAQG
jgi:hypothetical protein